MRRVLTASHAYVDPANRAVLLGIGLLLVAWHVRDERAAPAVV
jgi:hypothetical protein